MDGFVVGCGGILESPSTGNDDLYGKNGIIYGGVCNGITASMGTTLNVFGGNIQYVGLAAGCELNINGGTISSVYGGGNNCVVYDYTAGQALPADFNPYDMLYLSYDLTNKTITGLLGGNVRLAQDFGVYAPSEWGNQAKMEVVILPGATATVNCFRFTGDLLVQGTLQASPDISTNPMVIGTTPYYAINADSETVASVSAGDSIVRDGVTFVPEGEVVTLKSKGTGAMHWAAQPAYLNVTNNKFYMPDEVVSVKASALPLEATPTIQVDSEKLTGFTAGEYYSISDAIFRPTGTTLPIRPEWYGTTVPIVKLRDGFATGDSFAQALAIPSQSGGTVTPPNPGGGTGSKPDPDDPEEIVIPDGDWEEAEEELSQADSGDTVIVETDEDDALPDEVLESAAGKNVTLKIKVGDSIFWEIDCRVIPKDASLQDISLKVSMNTQGIPSKVLCGLPGSHTFLQMTLGHDGLFGFPVKLHADVGRGNSGKWANLYYYNEGTGKMEFETAARVTASGDAAFTMTHASQYAIVLDEKSHTLSFQDVKEGSWFQDAVEYVYRAGLMAGTGDTTFEPNAKLTRAMTAQILYNLEGTPEVTGEATFSDMNTAPDWSVDAIAWAQDTGVVAGMGDNTFAPNLKVTREQFAQMLYNYAKYKKCDLTKAGDLTKFPDEGSVSDWAVTALGYPVLMLCLSIAAIPLLLLEYFYTRERITEDMAVEVGLAKENSIPLMDQMRALPSNKYYVILTVLATFTGIVDNFKGGNVQYFYVKFLLGGAEDPMMFTIYQIATGIPLGLGAIFAYPVARKIGIRNFTYLGYICILAGSVLGLLFPSNLPIAITAGFLRQGGLIPNNYVFATLLCFAFDSVEFRSHLRLEGLLGVSIIGAVQTIIYAPFAGGYESTILKMGFVDAQGVAPGADVQQFMVLAFYLFDLICATAYLILLPFVDVEKKMPQINSELQRRKKEAVLAQGREWIEPEELERREREALAAQHEADRIADLKALCQRKGLDFDTENQKYLYRQAKKEAKAAAKAARKHR